MSKESSDYRKECKLINYNYFTKVTLYSDDLVGPTRVGYNDSDPCDSSFKAYLREKKDSVIEMRKLKRNCNRIKSKLGGMSKQQIYDYYHTTGEFEEDNMYAIENYNWSHMRHPYALKITLESDLY